MAIQAEEDQDPGKLQADTFSRVYSRGPGPFITHRVRYLGDGVHLVASSRRHRKGLRPHRVPDAESAERLTTLHGSAFCRLWAPRRIAWWVAILFAAGSALFTVGGVASTWPEWGPASLSDQSILSRIFVVGALFFTSAAWLQWLEVLNGDVALALGRAARPQWRWFGWCPRNLGFFACTIQFIGTVMFNFNTLDATFRGLDARQEALWIWAPNMAGCVCFLVASYLAYAEVSQGFSSFAIHNLSWWIAVVNLLGSVAFQVSALYSFSFPAPASDASLSWANFYTAVGGLCFLLGSYLMIPEIFDEEQVRAPLSGSAPRPDGMQSKLRT